MIIPTIETPRLRLRGFTPADFEAYAALNADPEVMRFIAPVQDREASFRSFCAAIGHWDYRGYGPWAVEEKSSSTMIGRAGLMHWEGWPGLEVGFTFAKSAWGKGYASEAAAACLRYARETVGAREVISVIAHGHTASEHVAQKLGARKDYDLRMKDMDVTIWRYA